MDDIAKTDMEKAYAQVASEIRGIVVALQEIKGRLGRINFMPPRTYEERLAGLESVRAEIDSDFHAKRAELDQRADGLRDLARRLNQRRAAMDEEVKREVRKALRRQRAKAKAKPVKRRVCAPSPC